MVNVYRNYYQFIINVLNQQTVTADSVSPVSFQITDQWLTRSARIISIDKVNLDPLVNGLLNRPVKFSELLIKLGRSIELISHSISDFPPDATGHMDGP